MLIGCCLLFGLCNLAAARSTAVVPANARPLMSDGLSRVSNSATCLGRVSSALPADSCTSRPRAAALCFWAIARLKRRSWWLVYTAASIHASDAASSCTVPLERFSRTGAVTEACRLPTTFATRSASALLRLHMLWLLLVSEIHKELGLFFHLGVFSSKMGRDPSRWRKCITYHCIAPGWLLEHPHGAPLPGVEELLCPEALAFWKQ